MKKILFPTDYTAQSKVAFRYAQKLALYFETSITLVHVYKPESKMIDDGKDQTSIQSKDKESPLSKQEWNRQWAKLNAFADDLKAKQYDGIPLEFIVVEGTKAEEIIRIQKEIYFDLMVMGMQRHNLVGRMFGNTSYRLIDEVNCPLLLIPPDMRYKKINKIAYGTALRFGEDKTVERLLEWCLAFDATLDVLHIHSEDTEKVAVTKMASLLDSFQKENEIGIINPQMRSGAISKAVHNYINQNDTDLLAIHRRKKGMLEEIIEGSLTKILSEEVYIPLLILKATPTAK